MAYERILLERAPKQVKGQLIDAANRMLPEFAAHALWRPKAREMIGQLMEARDRERLKTELNHGVRSRSASGSTSSDVGAAVLNDRRPGRDRSRPGRSR